MAPVLAIHLSSPVAELLWLNVIVYQHHVEVSVDTMEADQVEAESINQASF